MCLFQGNRLTGVTGITGTGQLVWTTHPSQTARVFSYLLGGTSGLWSDQANMPFTHKHTHRLCLIITRAGVDEFSQYDTTTSKLHKMVVNAY